MKNTKQNDNRQTIEKIVLANRNKSSFVKNDKQKTKLILFLMLFLKKYARSFYKKQD